MAVATIYGLKDVYISDFQPDVNHGVEDIDVGWIVDKYDQHGLLRADLSTIPAGSTNLVSTLYLYVDSMTDHAEDAYTGIRQLRAWVELEATWNIWATGESWASPGGITQGQDTDSGVSFGPWNPTGDLPFWTSVDCTAFVQDAWANRGKIFDCLIYNNMLPAEDENAAISFDQRLMADQWYISVTYDPPAGAPNIAKISGVDWANVKKVSGVAEASISKVSGVTAN